MKAIILAAGMGTRLRPLTDDRPKCLVPLRQIPLFDYQLGALKAVGVNDVSVVTGYQSAALESYQLKRYENRRFDTTNMVHSLFCAESEFDDDLIVLYGDIVVEPRLLKELVSCSHDLSVVVDRGWLSLWQLRMDNPLADAESLAIDATGFISSIGQPTATIDEIQGQYIGLFKIGKNQLSAVKRFYHEMDRNQMYCGKDFDNMFMTSFIQNLINSGFRFKPVFVDHGWLEVDTMADWQLYNNMSDDNGMFDFRSFENIVDSAVRDLVKQS